MDPPFPNPKVSSIMFVVYILVGLLFEFSFLAYAGKEVERPIDRAHGLVMSSLMFVSLAVCYASSWPLMGQQPMFIDMRVVYGFALVNAIVAITMLFALAATRRQRA